MKTGHRTLTDVHWICKSSDGDSLACVYEKGTLHLINHDGKKVMDKEFPYGIRNNDYCFHNGLCIMYDENGRFGLIDKQGKWSVEPQYYEIEYDTKGFWLVQDRDWNYGLLDRNSIFITPPSYSSITDIGHNRYHCEGACGSVIPDSKGNEYSEKL